MAPSLQAHNPDYGVILPSQPGYHAWQLMEMVAKRDLQQGYWEKTDTGYRLMGISVAPRPPSGVSGDLRWWLTGGSLIAVVGLVGSWFVYRRLVTKRGVAPAPQLSRRS